MNFFRSATGLSKSLYFYIIGIFFILLFLPQCSPLEFPHPMSAVKGNLDLRPYDFYRNPKIELRGEWKIYWQQWLPTTEKTIGNVYQASYINVPDKWTQSKRRQKGEEYLLPRTGFATYQVKILLPDNHPPLLLRIPPIDSAYQLFINGEKRSDNSKMANPHTAYPEYYAPRQVLVQTDIREMDLMIHLANNIYPRGGIRSPLILGRADEINAAAQQDLIFDLFILGALAIMALYHFSFFFINRSFKESLYFAILCVVIAVRLAVTGSGFFYQIHLVEWRVGTFLEYLTYYSAVPLFGFFVHYLYPEKFSRKIILIYSGFLSVFIAIVLFTPIMIYTQTLLYFYVFPLVMTIHILFVIVKELIKKNLSAYLFFISFIILAATVLNDQLYSMRIWETYYLSPFGFFLFVFSQAFLLSRRFSQSFAMVKKLTNELEERVTERTLELQKEKIRSFDLLHNILPETIAQELMNDGYVEPRIHKEAGVLFADVVSFTEISGKLNGEQIVWELDICYSAFDTIIKKHNLEKLKTMGDAYMCASGIPEYSDHHLCRLIVAGLEFLHFMQKHNLRKPKEYQPWKLRIGIHIGPVVAGVVGQRKFAYDIWGDTVNIASRMEKNSQADKLNVSATVYERVKHLFVCEEREAVDVKGKGKMTMYFIHRILPEYSSDEMGLLPNENFFLQIQ